MLSLDLFDSRYEKKLHEGAVDDTIAHLIEPLSRRAMDIRTQLRAGRLDPAQIAKLEKEYEQLVQKRLDIILDRKTQTQEQQVPSKQDPFAYVKPEPKGIGDLQDPKQKMAQLQQRAKKGPLANVGAGLKAFIKGEPEPMDEEKYVEQSPRAYGVGNFQRLVKANMGGYPTVTLEFSDDLKDSVKLDQRGLDLISDYYDGLANDAQKNHFIYRILPSRDETMRVLKKLGWQLNTQQQLPGIPTQGELPLSEKKKSDDLEAGDVKTARELQKIRAQYPAARSDVEALARAEIDSTERSQDQIGRIRSSNSRQDELLKQIMKIDSEQNQEIDTLDSEKDSIEAQLNRVQSLNDRLAQAMTQMTGARPAKATSKTATKTTSAPDSRTVIDLIPGAPADQQTTAKTVQPPPKPVATPAAEPTTSRAMSNIARTITGLSGPAPSIDKEPQPVDQEPEEPPKSGKSPAVPSLRSLRQQQAANVDDFKLVAEGQPQELINRYLAIDAENDVDAVRKAIQAISRDPELGATSKSRLLGQIGMIIKRHKLPIGRAYYQFMQQFMEAVNLDRTRVPGYPNDPATAKHRLDTAKAILSDPASDADSRRQAATIVAKLDNKVVAETVTNVKAGMAEIYRRLAPKIERHRDSFLAGQLYDELENYAELHGAEGEFKRMMATARGRAHMEYDTNPGGFHNWFWFLPFEDDTMTEDVDDIKKKMSKLEALALAANRAGDDAKCKMYQQKIQSLKQKLSQSMAEGWSDKHNPTPYSVYIDGREWKAFASDDHARAVAEKVQANLERQGRKQTVTIAPSKAKKVQEDFGMPGTTIPRKSLIQGYTVFWNPKTQIVSVTRGGDSEEAAIEQVKVGTPSMKNFRQAADRLIDRIESDLNEAREIQTREDFIRERDRLLRMIGQETNPANKQILKSAIRQLENRAENEGWITTQTRMVREDNNNGEAVEMAIMRRMLVAHTDLIVEFGLDKVVQAIEEVAYNVGDTDEIGSSDVSGWVNQVKQILGVEA